MSKHINDTICCEILLVQNNIYQKITLFISLNTSPVYWNIISYWCGTNNFIYFFIHVIGSVWITDIYNNFFWPQIEKWSLVYYWYGLFLGMICINIYIIGWCNPNPCLNHSMTVIPEILGEYLAPRSNCFWSTVFRFVFF